MARAGQAAGRLAALFLALLAAACAIDDSGPVRSVWNSPTGRPSYLDVVYVTDREPDAKMPGGFSTRWADKASCGTAEAVLPTALKAGEAPQYGYVAGNWPAVCARAGASLGGAVAAIEAQAKARHCDSVFLFIHGFHTGFDGGVLRAAQVAHDAGTGCAVAAFSWSAEISVDRYVADLEHSEYSEPFLAEFLRELAESKLRVTILAHSMGNRLLLATLSGLAHGREPVKPGFIDQAVLAAADVGSDPANDDFRHLMQDAARYIRRTTIYASSNDSVLEISEREHGGVPRLGFRPHADQVYQASDTQHIVDVIDVSRGPADRLDHSYYAMSPETIADMDLALKGVLIEERMAPPGGGQPTIVCSPRDACSSNPRYKLALPDDRHPRLVTRIIVHLIPLIPLVR